MSMYMSCSNYVNICRTHTQSPEHCHTSVITVVPKTILRVMLVVSCLKAVTRREILCSCIQMLYVVVLSKYVKCVNIVKVYHNSSPIPHLVIFGKKILTEQLSFIRPLLNYTLRSLNRLSCDLAT